MFLFKVRLLAGGVNPSILINVYLIPQTAKISWFTVQISTIKPIILQMVGFKIISQCKEKIMENESVECHYADGNANDAKVQLQLLAF